MLLVVTDGQLIELGGVAENTEEEGEVGRALVDVVKLGAEESDSRVPDTWRREKWVRRGHATWYQGK